MIIALKGDNLRSGRTLVDTGSRLSLVRIGSLVRAQDIKECDVTLESVIGDELPVIGSIVMPVYHENVEYKHEFIVVSDLPENLDCLIGLDFMNKYDVELIFRSGKAEVKIPPRTEKVVEIPLKEKGDIFVTRQEIKPGVFVADSLTTVRNDKIIACIINTTAEEVDVGSLTINYERPPTKYNTNVMTMNAQSKSRQNEKRHQLLDAQLRLDHVTEGRESLRSLCHQYVDVFHLPGDKLTDATGAVHSIPTPNIPPERAINLKSYRIPEAHHEEVDRQVKQMLEDGIIAPSTSPFNFPLLVVPKKVDASGKRKWRVCIDFRRLNDVTIGDSYPLPNIQDMLDKLGRSRFFTALDCASGYHQMPIAQEDRKKTAFSTSTGHYEYNRMPFGLKAAPATFQRLMNNVLSGLIGFRCLVYLDDIVLFGETIEEHNEKLRNVFDRLRQYNLRLQPDKCELLKD
jgi:hypothetical protein